ncbi:MAG: deoxyribodipyrimidine photo-lyase [Phycisphaerales bacterium]
MRALVWFRSDLRTRDNRALWQAAAESDRGVVGAYVIAPEAWRAHDVAACRVDFTLRTLAELSRSLAGHSIPLVVLTAASGADVPRLLLELATRARCDGLYFNREYEVDESRRDVVVTAAFEKSGRRVRAFDDQVILPPGEVWTGDGRFFTVFTPYKRAWLARLAEQGIPAPAPLASPRRQPDTGVATTAVPSSVSGFESPIDSRLWPAGEGEALRRLKRFAAEKIGRYKSDRDAPEIEGTSTLSPYLAVGAISPRQCLAAAMEANGGRADGGRVGPATWISELIWREFYVHVLAGYPRVCMNRAFKPVTDRLVWREDEAGFDAWCAGRTGYPIVDAAMRQLAQTGWMHNRLRMIAAMFLTKDLLIDWRRGERFFMQSLIDGFFASNNGGWQWSASTGTDAVPYFRVFNPASQSRQNDPEGAFIRRFVPELASLDAETIHDPPPLVRTRLGYPEPIVDHGAARKRVMEVFRALSGTR